MAKYSWDAQMLLAKKNELKTRLETDEKLHKQEELLDLYAEVYDLYNDLIRNYDIRANNEKEHCKIITDNSNSYNIGYLKENVFDSISKEKIKLTTGTVDISKKYKINFEDPFFETLPINNDELIKRTRLLYEQLPDKRFIEQFDKFTDPSKNLFHIRYFKKLTTDCKGLSFVNVDDNIPYGLVARDNTIQDIITTAHEVLHMIIRQHEEPFFITSNKTVYSEVEGFFANILFSQILKDLGYNKKELSNYRKRDLLACLDVMNNAFIVESGFRLMDNYQKIDFQKLTQILHAHNIFTPMSENNFPFLIDEDDFEEDINYSISYLIALDLYDLYTKDPEKALHHLLMIPMLSGDEIYKDLESIDATFFEDGYINLDKHCKKLLKRNTTSKLK